MKLGFIGLGIMGAPMAGHLRAAGHELFVNTRSKVPAALSDAGAIACSSLWWISRATNACTAMPTAARSISGR